MLAVFILLLVLSLGHCQDNDLPSGYEIESSINRTIEEVERQVRENPKLPRLTRQQIVHILENITSQDLNAYKDKEKLEKARKLYQRALMVVLPYNAEKGSLNDLYTKPPMTQIIPDRSFKDSKQEDNEVRNEVSTENLVSQSYKPKSKNQYKNHRETYSEVQGKLPLKETLKLDSTPVRFSFNLENLQKSYTTERTTTKRYPVYEKSDLEIVYSTSVTEPTTKSTPKEIVIDLDRSKATQNVLTSSQWRYNAPPSTLKPTLPSNVDKIPFLPTVNKPEEPISTERVPNETTELYISSEQPTALYVTPMSTETSPRVKYSSTYSVNAAGFRASTTSTMRPEVMDLLESIGLRPDNYSNVEDVYKKNKNLLESSELNSIQGLVPAGSDSPSIHDQNTFESSGFEIKKGMENLTPEVQMLFQRFGLQTSNLDTTTTTTTKTVSFNSYTNFKPLPTSSVKDQGMKEFLAKFGLVDNRRQKSMRPTEASLIEAVPQNMRGILENIGLISSTQKDMETETTNHVFKPHEVNVKDEEQRSKINELLDTVKLVQQGKADIQNVKKAANDLIESTKTLKDGPDPLKLEEIIRNYSKELRNEVKRQEQVTTVSTTEETIATTESTTTSTDSTKSADQLAVDSSTSKDSTTSTTSNSTTSNLMALEESFGGTTPEPDPVLPPKRKNGLYFLVDWNTFLEVGEDDKEKINLRFQPKVGDRTRFLPVSVP
ncbi:uncharacterized protein LOC105664048 [Megachile rotundata]|uniref:uncharacterized protein LOC105664048 n=1 Tax=Megachile rotundata TaxID=143995 RepID=UPI003FD3497E